MKIRKTIISVVDNKRLFLCQNISLRGHKDSTKNLPQLGKVVLPIPEILQNYYDIQSRQETKILKTSFRKPHDILFQFRFFMLFSGISRKTVILIIYSFLCFTAWLAKINKSVTAVFNMLTTCKSCGKNHLDQ